MTLCQYFQRTRRIPQFDATVFVSQQQHYRARQLREAPAWIASENLEALGPLCGLHPTCAMLMLRRSLIRYGIGFSLYARAEYSVEPYGINQVLRIVIHPKNDLLTSYNSLLQGSKSHVDLPRFKTLRIELRFPGFQDLTPLQHPPRTKKVPKRPIAKLLDLVRNIRNPISRIWGDHLSKVCWDWGSFENLSSCRTSPSGDWNRILVGKSGRSRWAELQPWLGWKA